MAGDTAKSGGIPNQISKNLYAMNGLVVGVSLSLATKACRKFSKIDGFDAQQGNEKGCQETQSCIVLSQMGRKASRSAVTCCMKVSVLGLG